MFDEKKYRLGVLMMIRRNNGREYLIIRKKGRDEWQMPAGGKQKDETIMDTFRREINEELGCSNFDMKSRISYNVYQYEFPDEWKLKRNCFGQRQFIIIVDLLEDVNFKPDGKEIEEIKFVSKENLLSELSHKELRDIIRKMELDGEIHLDDMNDV